MADNQVLQSVTQVVTSEGSMLALGMKLGQSSAGCAGTIFLQGDLGVGKTTLVRGLLRGKGYVGIVKSPTYSLMVSYRLPIGVCYHLDLYRLNTSNESELLGLRDLLAESALILIEWPERVSGWFLPDVGVQMRYGVNERQVFLQACTKVGNNLLCGLLE